MKLRKYHIAFSSLLLTALLLVGCGRGIVPMKGKVIFRDDQTPATQLEGYTLSFQSVTDETMGTATVKADGTFEVSTFGDQDGLKLGMHRVTINPPLDAANGEMIEDEPVYDPKYNSFQYSDLEVNVYDDLEEIVLQLDRFTE